MKQVIPSTGAASGEQAQDPPLDHLDALAPRVRESISQPPGDLSTRVRLKRKVWGVDLRLAREVDRVSENTLWNLNSLLAIGAGYIQELLEKKPGDSDENPTTDPQGVESAEGDEA